MKHQAFRESKDEGQLVCSQKKLIESLSSAKAYGNKIGSPNGNVGDRPNVHQRIAHRENVTARLGRSVIVRKKNHVQLVL
jgi:hypothetical protein